MIPVSLKLQNFLSYGSDAEALDFTQFDVACLSGANGQGKSALLDSITWVLWGQARKSANVRKPDAELLRIGTQDMRVELVFDVESERYRVERSFSQSASGKTSKSGLEISIYGDADWRTLTSSHQTETQARLESIVGVDYDTFVNASFLVQGRADEFTRRKPEERKEVLARILNLQKYEALAEKAGEHERAARNSVERMERDGEALDAIIAQIPALEVRHREVEAELGVLTETRTALAKRLDAAVRAVLHLQAQQEQAGAIDRTLARLDETLAALDAELLALDERIARGEALLVERDAILADARRYEALSEERGALQACALADRDLENRIAALVREIEKVEAAHRQRLDGIATERALLADRAESMEAELLQRPVLEKEQRAAEAAAAEWERLAEQRRRRDGLREERERLDREIERGRVEREAELASLTQRIRESRMALPDPDVLDHEEARLQKEYARFEEMRKAQQEIEQSGKALGEEIGGLSSQIAVFDAAQKRLDTQQERLTETTEALCPTCGTPLTDEHRQEVQDELRLERVRLQAERVAVEEAHAHQSEEQAALRRRFVELKNTLVNEIEVRNALTRVEEQRKAGRRLQADLREWNEVHARMRRQLEEKLFAGIERQRLAEIDDLLKSLALDETHLDRIQRQAARLDGIRDNLARLDGVARALGDVRARIEALDAEKGAREETALSGALLHDLPHQKACLAEERAALGFDAARLEIVQAEFDALRELPRRRAELESARENRDAWVEQQTQRRAARAEAQLEQASLREQRETLSGIADQLVEMARQKEALDAERTTLDAQVSAVQQQLGGLDERCKQARAARTLRAEARAHLDDARQQVALYRHMRQAFSRKGIPSLIIEQTLPEIEERANLLLDRLTEGRMHVRLESLRDKKTGGTAETLDIIISDELGVTRPYETYSGGEAFRVNFALRIALSQLLAERSGARIRTLVIDEGFGTQDAQGVQRLIEAINSVREDFDKILVVTHLDSLKNAFPTRIEVYKDPVLGSQYQIVAG